RLQPSSALSAGRAGGNEAERRDDRLALHWRRRHGELAARAQGGQPERKRDGSAAHANPGPRLQRGLSLLPRVQASADGSESSALARLFVSAGSALPLPQIRQPN